MNSGKGKEKKTRCDVCVKGNEEKRREKRKEKRELKKNKFLGEMSGTELRQDNNKKKTTKKTKRRKVKR